MNADFVFGIGNPLIDITITAIPGEGYEFSEWSNGQSINPIFFNLSSNTDLTATFVTKDD